MPYFSYWGKTDSAGKEYHPLYCHCLDVSAVASQYLHQDRDLLEWLSGSIGIDEEKLLGYICFFFSLHDIGKYSESFQRLSPILFQILFPQRQGAGPEYTRHDNLGFWLLRDRYLEHLCPQTPAVPGMEPDQDTRDWLDVWFMLAAGHHGRPPDLNIQMAAMQFMEHDVQCALEFADNAAGLFVPRLRENLSKIEYQDVERLRATSWYLAGLLSFSDWVGSNESYFPQMGHAAPATMTDYWHGTALPRADKALLDTGVLPVKVRKFNGVGSFLPEFAGRLTPLQQYLTDAELPGSPQLWIIEDVTGAGKTEAALILAHRMLASGLGCGLYWGMPTMATSNAMFARVRDSCAKLLQCKPDRRPSLVLAHGAKRMSDHFCEALDRFADAGTGNPKEDAGATCAPWFADSNKKALLAHLGVGTLDQALLSVLPVKYQSLRSLGLLHKVLIADEVHAYDVYTSRLLEALLGERARCGGSVVLLSATLHRKQRQRLANAFRRGLGAEPVEMRNGAYPLATCISEKGVREVPLESVAQTQRSVRVSMHWPSNEEVVALNEMVALIESKMERGRCVCWIRNTISDVLEARQVLADFGIPLEKITVFHSRFLLRDRLAIERLVLDDFGHSSGAGQRGGRLLLASQVAEQSLDLDFDVMVSDLAPVDLLIQRAGRLHRHRRDETGNRLADNQGIDRRSRPVLHVYGPQPCADPGSDWYSSVLPKAQFVYPHTVTLWRTSQALCCTGSIDTPAGVRELIERVYGERAAPAPKGLENAEIQAEGREQAELSMAQMAVLRTEQGYCQASGQWQEDFVPGTRLGERQSTFFAARRRQDGQLVPLYDDGKKFAWDYSSIALPLRLLGGAANATEDITDLNKLGEQDRRLGPDAVLVFRENDDGRWLAQGQASNGDRLEVSYSTKQGLEVNKS